MILSSRHYINNANTNKLQTLKEFIKEYRRVAQIYIDYLWTNGINITTHKKDKTKTYHFDAKTKLDCPDMLCDTLDIQTTLTGRARKCCLTQVLGIIKASVEKQRKRYFVANSKRAQHKHIPKKLRKALRHHKPVKPNISNINPELNSVCVDYKQDDRTFDGWLRLHSFTNDKRAFSVKLPIKHHRHSRKLSNNGVLMSSFLLTDKYVDMRWTQNTVDNKGTMTVGADQGIKTVLTLSDGQTTPDTDKHGHSLVSILQKMSRKKKGSKAFRKAQEHRTNFINWSINSLCFANIKQINFEEVKYLRFGSGTSRHMSHWTYTDIRDKVDKRCSLEEVLLKYDSSTYYSQRCSQCGIVLKSNRKGKVYSCKNCGFEVDSDMNAALNHQHCLPDISGLRNLKMNIVGFFWKPDGVYTLNGELFTVSLSML